jgi:two-component system NarL family sensor kinase
MQSLIDDLPEEILVLDENNIIVAVNRAFRETVIKYGYNPLQPGECYRDFVADLAAKGYEPGIKALAALDDIASGKRHYWQLVYNGGERWGNRDFQLCYSRIKAAGATLISVTRFDLTDILELRRIKGNAKPLIEAVDFGSDPHFAETVAELVGGFSEQVAIVDENWNIIAVNDAWANMVEYNGYPQLNTGTNYLTFLNTFGGKGHANIQAVRAGIAAIDGGAMKSFELTYAGVDLWEGRTLHVRINRLHLYGRAIATITREDVTAATELQMLREEFSNSVIRGRTEERQRLARELHDSTSQSLATIGLLLGRLKRELPNQECLGLFEELQDLLGEAHREIRAVTYLAQPPALEKVGLAGALKALIEGFGRRTRVESEFEISGEASSISADAEGAIYRVAQEALTNVHHHARAQRVRVLLCARPFATHLVVADDGVGISDDTLTGTGTAGVGLASMRSRLSPIGRLSVRRPPQGTEIVASVRHLPKLRVADNGGRVAPEAKKREKS